VDENLLVDESLREEEKRKDTENMEDFRPIPVTLNRPVGDITLVREYLRLYVSIPLFENLALNWLNGCV
jgi:hypothetical protein